MKMYHSVGTSELDHHTHRFLWRNLEVDRKPDIYTITAVSFGDKPAGAIASLALRKTAEMGENEYPEASSLIKKNTYMDNYLTVKLLCIYLKLILRNQAYFLLLIDWLVLRNYF